MPEITPSAPATPGLDEFLAQAKPLNPQYSDADITAQYHQLYPAAAAAPPTTGPPPDKQGWVSEAATLNPAYTPEEIAEQYDTLYPRGNPVPPSTQGDTARGFTESFKQLPQLLSGVEAGVGAFGENLVGAGGLFTQLKNHGIKGYQEMSADLAKDSKLTDSWNYSYDQALNQGNPGALVDWLQHGFGYVAGQTAQMVATGGIGSLAGKLVLKGATEKIVSGLVAKEAAALAGAEEVTAAITTQAVKNVAGKMGQNMALGATATGMEGGEIFGDLTAKAQEEGRDLTGSELLKAGVMTGMAGVLEFVGDKLALHALFGKLPLGKSVDAATGLGGRLARGTVAGAGVGAAEGATEYGQTILEEWGKGTAPIGTVTSEMHAGAVDSAALGALGGTGVGGTGGLLTAPTPATPPLTPEEKQDPLVEVAPIAQAPTVDEAIAAAHTITAGPVDLAAPGGAIVADAFTTLPDVSTVLNEHEVQRAADQTLVEQMFTGLTGPTGDALLSRGPGGEALFGGAPLRVLAPTELPETTPPEVGGLSQENLVPLQSLAGLFGKRLVVVQPTEQMVDGAVHRGVSRDVIMISATTRSADVASTLVHELFHHFEKSPLYQAFIDTVWEHRTGLGVQLARARHTFAKTDDDLKMEMGSDIAGTELLKPEVVAKILARLNERLGIEATKAEVVGFLDHVQSVIGQAKSMIVSRPWSFMQKTLASLYVTKLEAVHDTMSAAAAEALYDVHVGTLREKAQKGKLALSSNKEARTVVHPLVAGAFTTMAETHRGLPTLSTRRVQSANVGGVLNPVVEGASSLLSRMTDSSSRGSANQPAMKESVNRLLASLTHAYGFEKEAEQNLRNTAKGTGVTYAAVRDRVDAALKDYHAAHNELPVYNRAQWLAREIAMAVGIKDVPTAIAHLKDLKEIVESPTYTEHAFEHTMTPEGPSSYLHPTRVSTDEVPSGPDRAQHYTLLEHIPGHKEGETITRAQLKALRRRPHLTDVGARMSTGLHPDVTVETRTTLSTTVPSAKDGLNNALTQVWHISGEHIRQSLTHLKSISTALRKYPGMSGKGTQLEVLAEFHTVVTSNVLWIYDLVPEHIRRRAAMWYTGANRIASEWAKEDGYTLNQHAAVMAVNSPETDWYQNMSRADRIRQIVKNYGQFAFSQEMLGWVEAYAEDARSDDNIEARGRFLDRAKTVLGKKLDDLTGMDAAYFIRFFDETYHSKHYRVVTPEGGFNDYVRKLPRTGKAGLYGEMLGEPANMAWKSFNHIAKSVSILRDGSNENIHIQLGNKHKVRSFYNNILDPKSTEGHVTIDTHATGAGIFSVVAANDREPAHTFGKGGSNAATGASGSYGLLADAYRDAGKQRGVLPSSMQSITWEAIRSIFPDTMKKKLRPLVKQIWRDVRKGELTIEQARDKIYALAGGIKEFNWEHGGLGLSPAQGGKSFDEGMHSDVDTLATGTRRLPGRRGVSGGERLLFSASGPYQDAGQVGTTLVGLPSPVAVDGEDVEFFGFKRAQDAARDYMKAAGLTYTPETVYHKLDKDLSIRIANAYEAMKDEPNDPEVKAAYAAMAKETTAQYRAILKTGLVVEFFPNNEDTYGNPRNAILDVVENNHFYVFSTKAGFGSNATFDSSKNPNLAETEFKVGGETMLVNDLFRVVHDYFGHIKDGVGFRAEGEDNAWYSHQAMYSPLARRAMTTETRGQNSWVNYGPHGEFNRKASPKDTIYADQKTGLLPDWAVKRVPKEGTVGPKFSVAQTKTLETLQRALPTTTDRRATKFLLPDGTRLTWPTGSRPGQDNHRSLATLAGLTLDDIVSAGGVRYVPIAGVEIGAPLSTVQAERIIDDWSAYNTSITIDVQHEGVLTTSHEFSLDEPVLDSPSSLQDWVAYRLEQAGTGIRFSASKPPFGIPIDELPDGAKAPKVDWNKEQAQDWVTVIPKDWKGTGWGKGIPTVYKAYVPLVEMPPIRTLIDMNYDWSAFKKTGVYPPLVIVIGQDGIARKLEDGHHRATYWKEKGFTHFPAYVVDFQKNVQIVQRAQEIQRNTYDPSATEADAVQRGIEGGTLLEAAEFLAKSAPTTDQQLIAGRVVRQMRRLQAAGVAFTLTVTHKEDLVPRALLNSRGLSRATLKANEVDVYIQGKDVTGYVGTSYRTVLHELIHAVTQKALYVGNKTSLSTTPLGQDVSDLFAVTNAIIRHFNDRATNHRGDLTPFEQRIFRGDVNALANPDEILAWTLTSRDMQAYLETIPYETRTLWGAFVDAIRSLLSLPASAASALSEVLRVADRVLDADVHTILTDAITTTPSLVINQHTELVATRDGEKPRMSDAPTFYSQVERVLEQKMPNKALAAQITGILSPANGVKPDEVKWLGMDDFLKTQSTFTKAEVLAFVKANNVQVDETMRGEKRTDWIVFDGVGNEYFDSREKAVAYAKEINVEVNEYTVFPARAGLDRSDTKYDRYQTPGGEAYRELLLRLPTVRLVYTNDNVIAIPPGDPAVHQPELFWFFRTPDQVFQILKSKEPTEAGAKAYILRTKQSSPSSEHNFTSSHFDEPNILVHIRFNDRIVDGKPTLFLEEVQSDWHQKGKKEGYEEPRADRKARYDALDLQYNKEQEKQEPDQETLDRLVRDMNLLHDKENAYRNGDLVPEAPFKKTWHELAMKRMLRYAAEHGYAQLAWTTGAMQADRYDLSKQVTSIHWTREKGLYTITAKVEAGTGMTDVANDVAEEKLADYVGKELAQKIIDERGKRWTGVLRGVDLKVGGEGMEGFYDLILPAFMNKYLKKWGTKVSPLQISTGVEGYESDPALGGTATVHAVTLTDEMRRSVVQEGQPRFSPRNPISPFPMSEPGFIDKWVRTLQDKDIDIKRVVEDLQAAGRVVADAINPIYAGEMYQKREQQRAADFTNDELAPLVSRVAAAGFTLAQFDKFLHARHVIVDNVNSVLAAMNPNDPNNTALSGMTDTEATLIYKGPRHAELEALAKEVDQMVATSRTLLVEYGLEKEQTVAQWRKTFKAYVPLRREGFDDVNAYPTGTGKSVRGSTIKTRGGSTLAVESILANLAQARDQIISRGEKQRPVIAFAAMLIQNPNEAIGVIDKHVQITVPDPVTGLPVTVADNKSNVHPQMVRRYDPVSKTMQMYPDPSYKGDPNVVNFRIKGEDYSIVFNEHIERSMEIAKAFKNMGTDPVSGIMAAIAPYTRYLAAINTQYNPIFGVVNFVRDAQFAMLTLASTPLHGKQLEVLNNARKALGAIYADARAIRTGGQTTSPMGSLWQRFEDVGGPTGYRDIFINTDERIDEIKRLMDPSAWTGIRSPRQLGARLEETPMFKLLSDYNLTMENSIRLGVFKAGVDAGLSDIAAASLAKNITVNFNKKGQLGSQAGSIYAFFNANVQGTARIAEVLFDRTNDGFTVSSLGKKVITGGLLVGVLQSFLLAMGGFDDDDPPEFVKQKNLIIPMPGTDKGYVMIPMPLGFNLLPTVGRLAAESVANYAMGRPINGFRKVSELLGATFSALSPVGGGGPVQTILPTVADPLAALYENRDFTGRKIYVEDRSSLDPTPGHARARDSATVWAKLLAKSMNWVTGGSDFTPGQLSPTPDAIDYLIGQATGGIGREVSKTAQVIQKLAGGEDVPVYKLPLGGRFAGSASGEPAIRNRFYDNLTRANIAWNELEGRAKSHQEFSGYLLGNPAARFAKEGTKIMSTLSDIKKNTERMRERGDSADSIKLMHDRGVTLMQRYNDLLAKAEGQ